MYRHWSNRQISQPPPDSGFGRETVSKSNQDSRSYSLSAKNNIIFPKSCKNKAVSSSYTEKKSVFQMLPREECSRGSCCSMPECHRKCSAEHKREKFMSIPSFLRAGARAQWNSENTLESPHPHTAGPKCASHIIAWTFVVGSKYPNPSSSPLSVLPSNSPLT